MHKGTHPNLIAGMVALLCWLAPISGLAQQLGVDQLDGGGHLGAHVQVEVIGSIMPYGLGASGVTQQTAGSRSSSATHNLGNGYVPALTASLPPFTQADPSWLHLTQRINRFRHEHVRRVA